MPAPIRKKSAPAKGSRKRQRDAELEAERQRIAARERQIEAALDIPPVPPAPIVNISAASTSRSLLGTLYNDPIWQMMGRGPQNPFDPSLPSVISSTDPRTIAWAGYGPPPTAWEPPHYMNATLATTPRGLADTIKGRLSLLLAGHPAGPFDIRIERHAYGDHCIVHVAAALPGVPGFRHQLAPGLPSPRDIDMVVSAVDAWAGGLLQRREPNRLEPSRIVSPAAAPGALSCVVRGVTWRDGDHFVLTRTEPSAGIVPVHRMGSEAATWRQLYTLHRPPGCVASNLHDSGDRAFLRVLPHVEARPRPDGGHGLAYAALGVSTSEGETLDEITVFIETTYNEAIALLWDLSNALAEEGDPLVSEQTRHWRALRG